MPPSAVSIYQVYEYFRTYFRGETASVEKNLKLLECVMGEEIAGSADAAGFASGNQSEMGDASGGGVNLEAMVERVLAGNDAAQIESLLELLKNTGEFDFAVQIRRRLLAGEMDAASLQQSPTFASTFYQTTERVIDLCSLYSQQGNLRESLALLRDWLERTISVCGRHHSNTYALMVNLAQTLEENGNLDEVCVMNEVEKYLHDRITLSHS